MTPEKKRSDAEAIRELAAHIDQLLWMLDPRTGAVLYASPGSAVVWGVSPEDLYRDSLCWIRHVHPEDRGRAEGAMRGREYRDEEIRVEWEEGSERVVRMRVFPIRGENRRVERLAGIAEDVTGRRQMAEALRAREAELRQAQKLEAVGQLAGGVAHDFNNLLTVMMGYSEFVLEATGEGFGHRGELEEIRNATRRAAALTQRLLAFSRKQVVLPRLVDLNTITQGLQMMIRRLLPDDIEISFSPGEDLGVVLADPGQMEQVLMNLAVNARDAMEGGGRLAFSTRAETFGAPRRVGGETIPAGLWTVLSASDTGHGIDEATLSRIFEPFFTTKEAGKGTGLGLATIHGIVKQSGGFVAVESEVGKGTTFTIFLPRLEGKAEAQAPIGGPADLRGTETVLLTEDQLEVREVARRTLAANGYQVLEASGPAEAMWLSQKHHGTIHLLLTDIVMAQMNGFDLADRLAPLHPEMKLMFMSGYTEHPVPDHHRKTPFLGKPFSPTDLLRKIRSALDG